MRRPPNALRISCGRSRPRPRKLSFRLVLTGHYARGARRLHAAAARECQGQLNVQSQGRLPRQPRRIGHACQDRRWWFHDLARLRIGLGSARWEPGRQRPAR
jgi:hypothetical protein